MSGCINCKGPLSKESHGYCAKPACFKIAMQVAHRKHEDRYRVGDALKSKKMKGIVNVGRSTKNFKNIGRPRKKREE